MSNKSHQYEIDLIRIISAVCIVLFHYTFRGYAADGFSKLFFPVLGGIFKYGYLGVYVFFILSGYTIVLSASNKNFVQFVKARILRLYPSFWIAVCITSAASVMIGGARYSVSPMQFLINLTMLSDFANVPPVDGVYWFMFVIIKFYFLIGLIILFNKMKLQKYIAAFWLLISLALIIKDISKISFFLMPKSAPFLISGMIFYSAKKEGWNLYNSLIMITAFLLSEFILCNKITGFNSYYSTTLSPVVVFSFLLSAYLIMFLLTVKTKYFTLPAYFTVLGTATYPLYLIHQNFGFMLFNKFGSDENKYIILALTFSLMVSLAILTVKYLDPYIYRKLDGLLKRFGDKRTYGESGR